MAITKRRRLSAGTSNGSEASGSGSPSEQDLGNTDSDAHSSSNEDISSAGSLATEDEIIQTQRHTKSLKTQKRKRRATSPSRFGSTLQALLKTDAPTNLPLSLKPSAAKRRTDQLLEGRAKKLLDGEKKEKEEKNHIQDVIGGWGAERERSLRKVAQRGVVKLFNAIQQTQTAAAAVQEETKAAHGSGKPSLPTPVLDSKTKKKRPTLASKTDSTLNQDMFLQMIKAGGIVSKS